MESYQLYIGGTWRDSSTGDSFPTTNPFTQEVWATIPQASAEDVADAVGAAYDAFRNGWRKTPGLQRAKLLYALADLLEADADRMGRIESTDNGKVIKETRGQMVFCARQYRFYAGFADKIYGAQVPVDMTNILDIAYRVPLGVVALIVPWNSPMALLANKLAPALAAGNCVVIKPSEHASATTLEFAKMIEAAGFPPGVVNVVTGDGSVGKSLSQSQVDKISFTGSTSIGRIIAAEAGRNLVPTTMELGGKSPNIVFADADIDNAIVGAMAGIFAATGQTCVAGSRLVVHRSIHDRMVERISERARAIQLGDPLDEESEMGTVANEPQFRQILGLIDQARKEGLELATGGGQASGEALGKGLFIQPTVFCNARNDATIAQTEVFGPVLTVIPFDDEEEAVSIGNDTLYGLAAGVWTSDINRALRVTDQLEAGAQ